MSELVRLLLAALAGCAVCVTLLRLLRSSPAERPKRDGVPERLRELCGRICSVGWWGSGDALAATKAAMREAADEIERLQKVIRGGLDGK